MWSKLSISMALMASLSTLASAQPADAIARCNAVTVPQFRAACFEAIRPRPSAPIVAQPSRVPQDAPFTNCDTYAASDLDSQHKAKGVPYDKINSALAIPACESAVRQYQNSSRLIFQLGRAYSKNNDFNSALIQYRKAADQGYAIAQYNLGVMYANGQGVVKDEGQAVAWYRKAAEQGNAAAQNNLGSMYANGQGVPQNYTEALKWYRKAIDQGDANAENNVGAMYAKGQGVRTDYAEAAKWYRRAAEKGNAVAQNNLTALYESFPALRGRERAADPNSFTVDMSVTATPTKPPVIMGTTNLPDGTKLAVHLLGDPPACVPRCGLEYDFATVESGRFTTTLRGPDGPLIAGSYTIDVATTGAHTQPKNVQSEMGKLGEHLRGPYVVTLGDGGKYVPVEFPRNSTLSDSEKLFGLMIHYTQKIYVAGDAPLDTAARTQAIADLRKWHVESCILNIDFVNALVRSGRVAGRETLGAERQAKIDACVTDLEAQLQAALKPLSK